MKNTINANGFALIAVWGVITLALAILQSPWAMITCVAGAIFFIFVIFIS